MGKVINFVSVSDRKARMKVCIAHILNLYKSLLKEGHKFTEEELRSIEDLKQLKETL